jgi:hypothetical protein
VTQVASYVAIPSTRGCGTDKNGWKIDGDRRRVGFEVISELTLLTFAGAPEGTLACEELQVGKKLERTE